MDELEKILSFCQVPRSVSEMIELLGRGSRDKFLTAILKPALGKTFLEMTIPDKPTSRLQKYVITKAGKARLNKR